MSLKSPFLIGVQETMGTEEVTQFLTFLANQRNVAINTQKIALNALAYLY
ncbi:phage integrase N-terminal SAM-like domain-containing protein, partial [Vibrio fluvialis]|nr:phage integrase N-terminal SAM-like domain-containing protein [Vibrio fluvialis]